MDVEVRRAFWASMREFTDSGRTVLFATHYLDEADDFADRVVVLADGRDRRRRHRRRRSSRRWPAGRSRRSIPGADADALGELPGVVGVEQQATRILLRCNDSDAALRALLAGYPDAHDIEIAAGNLEDAFLELTAASRQESTPMTTTHHDHAPPAPSA